MIAAHSDLCEYCLFPEAKSIQVAEIAALTIAACQLGRGERANIYTYNKYVCGVIHDFDMLWKQYGFLTASGFPIKHGSHIKVLLDALFCQRNWLY